MNRKITLMFIYVLTSIGLIILGILWRSWDMDNIRDLDYRKYSECIMRQNVIDSQGKINEIIGSFEQEYMHVVSKYRNENADREFIGLSGRYWLSSGYIYKITVVDTPAGSVGDSEPPVRQLLVFAGNIPSGSMPFLSITLLCMIAIAGLSVKKKHLPHIFPDDAGAERIENLKNDS